MSFNFTELLPNAGGNGQENVTYRSLDVEGLVSVSKFQGKEILNVKIVDRNDHVQKCKRPSHQPGNGRSAVKTYSCGVH